ncbi:GH25 family lysozyme [Weissella confusa]|uniref:GH25 family lysozyme n=1 Tax=Weissella confusa TaxID=1583 RepID=UPI002F269E38
MTLNGIDISNWQAGINLSAVPADFVIVKATQGTTYVSPEADTQYQGAKSAGRLLGVYHFATGDGAVEEAKFFLSNVQGYLGEAALFLDWEGAVVTQGVGYAKIFLDYVYQQTGIRPLIYMSKSVTSSYDWSTVCANYGLWVAQYADSNSTGYQDAPWTDANGYGSWSGPAIFQYASTGRLSGYDGNLDLDKFYGDTEAWQAYAKSDRVTPEPPKSTPIVQYADPDGNKAYAYTHWQAIEGKPDLSKVVLTSPNGTKYQLQVDDKGALTTKVVIE